MPIDYPDSFDAPSDGIAPEVSLRDAHLNLRARAEKRRSLVTQATEYQTPEETQRLVQELQVHQIELEMQYEELLLAQSEIQTARSQYVDLYDFAPVGYFTLTESGLVVQLNLRGSQQLGAVRQRLTGRRFALFVAPADRLHFGQFLARVFSADRTQSCELQLQREDGTPFHAQLEGLLADAPAGSQCRLAVLDVTTRRLATEALAASEARFRKLFADSNDAVVLLQGHQYVDCNEAALRLLGARCKEDIVGHMPTFHTPEFQPDGCRTADLYRDIVVEAIRTGSQRCVSQMHRVSGEKIWVEAVLTAIELGGTTPVVHILWRDITAARAAQEELRREKEFTESLLENTVDGIIALNRSGHLTAWNGEAARYFGHAADAVLGRPLFEVLPFLDPETHQTLAWAQAGERVIRFGRPFRYRPGYYDLYLVPLKDHGDAQPIGVLVIIRDVTERNQLAEEATRMRLRQQQEVLAAILTTQETERKRIAEAIHNGLGQLLYATKLSLEGGGGVPRDSLRLLNEAIRTTRTISFELTPGILEDFGLRTALEELVKRIAQVHLSVGLHFDNLDERLPPPVEIAVYRIVQELLNNVMKHASATEVEVHVAQENGRIEVSVEDNGSGFKAAALATQPLVGIGLAGVRNRVVLLGGELSINSRLGKGTIISFELDV